MSSLYTSLITFFISACIYMTAYLIRSLVNKVHEVEDTANAAMTEEKTRDLITDKLDPIKDDLQEIKASIARINDLVLQLFKDRYDPKR